MGKSLLIGAIAHGCTCFISDAVLAPALDGNSVGMYLRAVDVRPAWPSRRRRVVDQATASRRSTRVACIRSSGLPAQLHDWTNRNE